MKKDILINSTSNEIRIAITEDGKLTEFFVESPDQDRNVGDIYYGKVARVMPGIRAAFINIGFPQDAFLHFSDIDNLDEIANIIGDDVDENDSEDNDDDNGADEKVSPVQQSRNTRNQPRGGARTANRQPPKNRFNPSNIERGQDIIVQVTKEPVGNKGVRVTSKVSIPGRYLVLMPFSKRIGVSKQIFNTREKYRLKGIVRSVLPKGFGLIIRTVAANQDENLILDDLNKLLAEWAELETKLKTQKPPYLVYKDASTTSSVVRDLFKEDVSRIIVDSKKLHKEISTYLEQTSPEFSKKLEFYAGNQPLFDVYNIEKQIDESLNKKVWIKGAGYIFIETTEAMTVVDVNSGKYAKNADQEINSLNTDIEAGREIVRQLRLRDIGGIIVIDFIDLYEERNRRKLYDEIRKEFRKDRAKVTVLPMSEFGLVQITRQRIRQSIIHRVYDTCVMCKGTGRIQSKTSYLTNIERWLQRYKGGHSGTKSLLLKVNPMIEDFLKVGMINKIRRLQFKYLVRIKISADPALALDEFRFIAKKTGKDVTEEYNN